MIKLTYRSIAFVLILASVLLSSVQAAENRPFPYTRNGMEDGHKWLHKTIRPWLRGGSYETASNGSRRSNQDEINTDVRSYAQYWSAAYIVKKGSDQYRVSMGPWGETFEWDEHVPKKEFWKYTTSEGQGYGMLIMATMGNKFLPVLSETGGVSPSPRARVIFNGLWRYAKAHPTQSNNGLMDWETNGPGADGPGIDGVIHDDSAFDGDADMALALFMAHRQWGQ